MKSKRIPTDLTVCPTCKRAGTQVFTVPYEDISGATRGYACSNCIDHPYKATSYGGLRQIDAYAGFNKGLDMHIRSKMHYDEVVKERGVTPVG